MKYLRLLSHVGLMRKGCFSVEVQSPRWYLAALSFLLQCIKYIDERESQARNKFHERQRILSYSNSVKKLENRKE
jgi:hypothetical protein